MAACASLVSTDGSSQLPPNPNESLWGWAVWSDCVPCVTPLPDSRAAASTSRDKKCAHEAFSPTKAALGRIKSVHGVLGYNYCHFCHEGRNVSTLENSQREKVLHQEEESCFSLGGGSERRGCDSYIITPADHLWSSETPGIKPPLLCSGWSPGLRLRLEPRAELWDSERKWSFVKEGWSRLRGWAGLRLGLRRLLAHRTSSRANKKKK